MPRFCVILNKEPWMPFSQGRTIKLHKDNCGSLEDGLKWSEDEEELVPKVQGDPPRRG